jgi:8-oxo-dGTP diphosphatase
VFAARRGPGRSSAGRWELPGGKVELGESDQDALVRELREELGVRARVGEVVGVGRHDPVELWAYRVESDDEPAPTEHDATCWLAADELGSVDWAAADQPLVELLRAILERSG